MDLSSIMNSDAAGSSRRPPSPSRVARKPSEPTYSTHDQPPSSSSSYASGYPNGPSQQPPPLQRAQTSPDRNSSYGALQSPYQYNAPSSVNANPQSQRGHSPPTAPHGPSTSRDSFAAPVAYPHSQHHPSHQQSPIAPQRSQSIQSVLTPYSSASHPFAHRDSPPAAAQHPYPPQQFSPAARGSLPGTPRGSAAAVYPHSTPSSARPQSSGHDSISNRASSPWIGQDAQMHMSPTAVSRPVRQDSRAFDNTPRRTSSITERRESDESVSPKTAFAPDGRRGSVAEYGQQPPLAQPDDRENGATAQSNRPSTQDSHVQPAPTAPIASQTESPKDHPGPPRPTKANFVPDMGSANSSPQQPRRKRRRYNEPPIYAQRTIRTKGKCPMIPNRLAPVPKHLRNTPQNPWLQRQQAAQKAAPPSGKIKREDAIVNGPPISSQQLQSSRSSQPPQSSEPPEMKSLGPWEPSITGFIPYEEITKIVCDFLFQHVVLRNDAMAGPAGASAVGHGAIIEVEAKLGQIIDLDRRDRILLPIQSECVIDKENSRFRTSFESNMTQAQHRAMNNFLNEAVKHSMPQANNTTSTRIPISYAHKKERDSFYEVSPSDLPPIIRQNLNPRHKPKVRVTHDQRTGEVLAKIVKCRVADLDVHSPRTCVDWRVSVNLEMSYDGDVSNLPPADTGRGAGAGDRNKDRMSYRHLAYQVDLTQVARSEPSMKGEFDHELEVEVSAAEIRRQGQMAMSGDSANQYEDLVKGLLDNIRVLARAVPA
ncbi:hypothetical protein BDV06DRAFT_182128 [Aspergillus oleicola]